MFPSAPLLAPALLFWEVVLALHIMAVVVAFGVTFAYPIIFAVVAARIRARWRCCTVRSWPWRGV